MRTALQALLLLLLTQGAVGAARDVHVSPTGLYSVSFPALWTPNPSIADDGELVLDCQKACGRYGAHLTFSERPAPAAATAASLKRLSARHWREAQAKSTWIDKVKVLREGRTRLGGLPAYESLVELTMVSGNRARRLMTLVQREGTEVRTELAAPVESWAKARSRSRAVIASLRWESALQPLLARADALRVEGNHEAAFKLYDAPELAGHPEALYWAGMMLKSGIGTPQDDERAVDRLVRSLERGKLAAGTMIGVTYLCKAERTNGAVPEVCAVARYALAAAGRSAEGEGALALQYQARLYMTGLCVERDVRTAIAYYEEAARAGDSASAQALATLYAEGTDVPKDPERAAHWERVASGQEKPAALRR